MSGFEDTNYTPPLNAQKIPKVDGGYTQLTWVKFFAVLSATAVTMLVPPDPRIKKYRIQNQSVTAAEKVLYTEDGFTPGTVSPANVAGRYDKLAANDTTYAQDDPSTDGVQAMSETGTPTVCVSIGYV
jgi:hypothetical protein